MELSNDASLSDITVDDESIEGFDPETYYYEYWVPSGTQFPPTVGGMVNYPGATIEITQASAIPGSANVLVTAEDGTTQQEYEVAFFMELSSDATLADLTVDDVSIEGFDPEIYYYEYWVPSGTQVPPTVNGMVNHPGATTNITQASAIPGSANILVTAEDGTTQQEYEVDFDFSIGLGENIYPDLFLYPNPAKNQVNIRLTEIIYRLEVFSHLRQLVYKVNSNSKILNVNVSEFESGIYFVKIFSQNNVITRKLVIE